MLSPELEERLERAKALENNYQPIQEIADDLASKTLVMVVAPTSMGKSLVIQTAAGRDDEFGAVPIFTTRQVRDDDQLGLVRALPHDDQNITQILTKIENRQVVQYAVHPTKGTFYGTELHDYAKPYNLLPTLSDVVEHLRNLPFSKTLTICLVTAPDTWEAWFNARFPVGNEDRQKRIAEAVSSLEWVLRQSDDQVLFLNNRDGELEVTADRLIRQARGDAGSDSEGRELAKQCLEFAQGME